MWAHQKKHYGFTIVELLIVIVVIAILAAISIAAYNGIQQRAAESVAQSDISNALKGAQLNRTENGSSFSTQDFLPTAIHPPKVSTGNYRYFSICVNDQGSYAVAAQVKAGGGIYVSTNGSEPLKNNAVDPMAPCPSLGISNAKNVYGGMPTEPCTGEKACTYRYRLPLNTTTTPCATDGSVCTFNGTKSISYGNTGDGRFIAKANVTSPVTCGVDFFSNDPAPGISKSCYLSDAGATTIDGSKPTTYCAKEGESCFFTGTKTIVYGSSTSGHFIAKSGLVSPVACDSSVFGGDPLPGIPKECFALNY